MASSDKVTANNEVGKLRKEIVLVYCKAVSRHSSRRTPRTRSGEDSHLSGIFGEFYSYVGSEVLTAVAMKGSMFWGIMPCSPLKTCYLFHAEFLLRLLFYTEDGGDMFLQNID
jgi:hypothetical protein